MKNPIIIPEQSLWWTRDTNGQWCLWLGSYRPQWQKYDNAEGGWWKGPIILWSGQRRPSDLMALPKLPTGEEGFHKIDMELAMVEKRNVFAK